VNTPRKKKISISLSVDQIEFIQSVADELDTTRSGVMRMALSAYRGANIKKRPWWRK